MNSTQSKFRNLAISPQLSATRSLVLFLSIALSLSCSASAQLSAQTPSPIIADRVIVVVNQQVILQSDLDRETRLSILDPNLDFTTHVAPSEILSHLISRALIRQQFVNQPLLTPAQLQQAVDARLAELHTQLPACVRLHCDTPEGWQAFLAESHLTAAEIEAFIREQLQILDFIEQRFRAGTHITPEQIQTYYKTVLLPQYSSPSLAPTLESVSSRINEVLLEKQVNLLLEDWLTTLRKEGDVEYLDPALAPTLTTSAPSTPAPTPITTGGPRP